MSRPREQHGGVEVERVAAGRRLVATAGESSPCARQDGIRHGSASHARIDGAPGCRCRGRRLRRRRTAAEDQRQQHEEAAEAARDEGPLPQRGSAPRLRVQQGRLRRAQAPALDVAAHGCIEEHAGARRGQGLVHEAVDAAVAQQLPEQRLVLASPGDDDDHVRKLLDDLLDQRGRFGRDGGEVEQQDTATAGQEQIDGLCGRTCAPHGIAFTDGSADRLEQRGVGRQHHDVDEQGRYVALGRADWLA